MCPACRPPLVEGLTALLTAVLFWHGEISVNDIWLMVNDRNNPILRINLGKL